MKILFCAYRDWAINIWKTLSNESTHEVTLVKEPKEMEDMARNESWNVIVLVGWSWKVPSDIVNSRLVIGMHPSDLPNYAGGSPIQNQILDGVESTKATLFKLNEKFDEGEIIDKEGISLKGHLNEVFDSISLATQVLLKRFIENFPNNEYKSQKGKGKSVRRLKPEHSKLPMPCEVSEAYFDGSSMGQTVVDHQLTCKQMWDFIRCREDPYPNAYFEDETGKLFIKLVEFEPKK